MFSRTKDRFAIGVARHKFTPSGFSLPTVLCLLLLLPAALAAVDIRHAKGFTVAEEDGCTVVRVRRYLTGEGDWSLYLLVPRRSEAERTRLVEEIQRKYGQRPDVTVMTPVRSFAALSTTYLYPLKELDLLDRLAAVDSYRYLYDQELRRYVKESDVAELGSGAATDLEKIVRLGPDLLMSGEASGARNRDERLARAGIPLVLNGDYLEQSPLGRAEWLKYLALFFEEEQRAERIFREIEERYLSLRNRIERGLEERKRPSVLLNRPMRGSWVLPGGESFMARLIEEAGGAYIRAETAGSRSVVMDIEGVYARALDAEFWIHQYGWNSLADVRTADPRLASLRAYREGNVLNNDARERPGGGNDFYESGPYRPDIILSDLARIFHPELLPKHRLYYYRYLK